MLFGPLFTWALVALATCWCPVECLERLKRVSDILGEPYDRVHELVVLDQIDNYLKPVESPETRAHKSLNGMWNFCLDPQNEGHRLKWFEKSLESECVPRGNFFKMPVPSAFNEIHSNKTVKNYMGWMWYQRDLWWPMPLMDDSGPPKSWILQLESINYLGVVWLQITHENTTQETHLVGSHAGGHLPLTLDLTDILSQQQQQQRTISRLRLTLAVSNMLTRDTIPSGTMLNETEALGRPYFRFQPDFDFFHFAGIMGDVSLFALYRNYITDVQVLPTSAKEDPPLSYNNRGIYFELAKQQQQERARTESLEVCARPYDSHSKCWTRDLCKQIERDQRPEDISGTNSPLFGPIEAIQFDRCAYTWTGILLTVKRAGAGDAGQPVDMMDVKLTKQELAIHPVKPRDLEHGIAHPTGAAASILPRLQGFGMHHEQLFSGRTMSLAAIAKDLQLLKGMGANVLRTSHYPYSRAYLDACDQLGLMVIAECPAVGLSSFSAVKLALHQQILLEMMQRDYRHSSIIAWSLANEPASQAPEAREYFAKLTNFARTRLRRFTVDAGRPLTAAIAQSHRDDTIGHLLDLIMVNRYFGWYDCPGLVECVQPSLVGSLQGWASKYPGKPLVLSEFGAETLAGFHSSTSELFSEEYQRDLLVEYERVFDLLAADISTTTTTPKINFLGSMVWNFADFSTHESLMRAGGNKKGVFTRWREPKLAAEAIRAIYTARQRAVASNSTSGRTANEAPAQIWTRGAWGN